MKLFYCETLNPRKACAAARFLNADVEFVRIDLGRGEQRTTEFLALNPNGKVPVLRDGEKTLWEANAIMCRLSDSVGADFWPHDERQIDVMRWLSWDANHFTRYGAELWFEKEIKPLFGQAPDRKVVEDAENNLRLYARVLNDHLAERRYVVAESVSVADFALAAALPYAASSQLPLDEFGHIMQWHDRLNELEAWREPFPVSDR
ncbi:glutathione S-transferase family protein [Rhizobium sp. BK376]|uniref:glutathione S-transferase family protein n=1 Tax=Rhizobium sp. BK376 TaxID=2512149 RepID=UPI00104E71B2|nr:glutathione S-transferase family protein [Rhizobium sp. BK376]